MTLERTTQGVLEEITDFLSAAPTLEQIIAFKPSDEADSRLQELLDRSSSGVLTPEERTELDQFLFVNHLLILLTAKARLKKVNSG